MSGLRMLALGVGDAFSALYYSSCLALEAEGSWLLIDCPHPIRKILREAGSPSGIQLDIDRLSGVVLTHLHADHSTGLEGLIYYGRYCIDHRATLLTHPDVLVRLWDGHLAGSMEWSSEGRGQPPKRRRLDDFLDVIPLSETALVQHGPFSILCRHTIHTIPTIALRISAGGRTLGYSADTAFDPGLIEWLAAADSIVHETSQRGLHTPYENLAVLPPEVRAKMRLIHYPDDFDRSASIIEALEQGRCYQI